MQKAHRFSSGLISKTKRLIKHGSAYGLIFLASNALACREALI
jgi:hypothetical protein